MRHREPQMQGENSCLNTKAHDYQKEYNIFIDHRHVTADVPKIIKAKAEVQRPCMSKHYEKGNGKKR